MASRELDEIIRRADLLTTEEQLRLIAHLAEKARESYQATTPRRRWSEIRGAVPFPAMGEDAQQWVSRTRRQADEDREIRRNEAP